MSFTAPELIQLPHGHLGGRVGGGGYGKGDKHLVHVQPRIVVAKVIHLQILYGLYHYGGYEVHILLYPAQALQRVEQHGSRSAKELSGLAGDYFAIGQCTPGVIAVNTATFIGQKQRGIAGGIVATLGVVLPSFLLLLLIAAVLRNLMKYRGVEAFLSGVRPCVVALILATAVTMGLTRLLGFTHLGDVPVPDIRSLLVLAVLAAVHFLWKKLRGKVPSPIAMIGLSAVLGILLWSI